MVYLEFGDGKIGVETIGGPIPIVCLSKLDENLEIGSKVGSNVGSEGAVKMIFKNKKGLMVLINALNRCVTHLPPDLPPDLRFGA